MNDTRMDDPRRPAVLMIGPFPPPVHGASLVTVRLAERLRSAMAVTTRDISPGTARGLAYHFARLCRVLAAAGAIVAAPRRVWIYLSADGGSGLIYGLLLATAARLAGKRVIVHHHSFAYINRRSRLMAALATVAGDAALHLALCPRMAERLTAFYPRARNVTVLSNAVFFSPPDFPATPSAGPLRLGHLSNLSPEKGLDDVIALQERLRAAGLSTRLALAGPIASARDAARVAAAVAASNGGIVHVGPLYGEAKERFLSELDVFLFPSRYVNEAEPLVVFEALAHGLPVLAYDRGCIAEQLGGQGGVAVAANAPFAGEAAARLADWAQDRAALAAARAAARQRMADLSAAAEGQFGALLSRLGVGTMSAET